jgi:hypothetical protein
MRSTGERFEEALNSPLDDKGREANHRVASHINQQMKQRLRWRICVGPDPSAYGALLPITVDHLSNILTEFLAACDTGLLAPSELRSTDYWGSAWNRMVGSLADFFEELPGDYCATAPNDTTIIDPSAFVAFVNAVQFQLPKEYQKHNRSSPPGRAGTDMRSQVSKALVLRRQRRGSKPRT